MLRDVWDCSFGHGLKASFEDLRRLPCKVHVVGMATVFRRYLSETCEKVESCMLQVAGQNETVAAIMVPNFPRSRDGKQSFNILHNDPK